VYRLGEDSRVYDAIQAAGGVTEAAAPDALNLAEPICDGMKITVPDHTQEQEPEAAAAAIERPTGAAAGAGTSAESSGKININTADRAALMTLKGIGEARADAILEYRAEHGNFSTIEDIMKVPGIKDAAFQKIKDRIQT
jgi:competence protein ComEA